MNIGDDVRVINYKLVYSNEIGTIISTDGDRCNVSFKDGTIVKYKKDDLELFGKNNALKQNDKIFILFYSNTPSFFDAEKPEYMQCLDVDDAKLNAAEMVAILKVDGYTNFWLSIIEFPGKVDIEYEAPKLIKL